MKFAQQGFTLVELIVVIVILGILAATALPRFINVTNDARIAAVSGISGGLRSAVAVVNAKWQSTGGNSNGVVMSDGTSVDVVSTTNGNPANTALGIIRAMNCGSSTECQGITVDVTATPSTWFPSGGSATTCRATYTPTTGVVSQVVTGC